MPEVSFGIEFEFDFLQRSGSRVTVSSEAHSNPFAHVRGWGTQHDPTAGAEIWTNPMSNLNEAALSISRQWRYWIRRNSSSHELVPFMYGASPGHNSLGQHIHIGRPNSRMSLDTQTDVASAIIDVYPLFIAIHANSPRNGYISHRDATSSYCKSMASYDRNRPVETDHYAEISASHNGTVELRAPDSNIPQATLTVVALAQKITERVLADEYMPARMSSSYFSNYRRERETALTSGVRDVDCNRLLESVIAKTGDIDLSRYPQCVRDILYMVFKKKKVPVNIFMEITEGSIQSSISFDYFKIMLTNADKYFENLLVLPIDGVRKAMIGKWLSGSQQITRLSDLRREIVEGEFTPETIIQSAAVQAVEFVLPSGRKNWAAIAAFVKSKITAPQEAIEGLTRAGFTASRAQALVRTFTRIINANVDEIREMRRVYWLETSEDVLAAIRPDLVGTDLLRQSRVASTDFGASVLEERLRQIRTRTENPLAEENTNEIQNNYEIPQREIDEIAASMRDLTAAEVVPRRIAEIESETGRTQVDIAAEIAYVVRTGVGETANLTPTQVIEAQERFYAVMDEDDRILAVGAIRISDGWLGYRVSRQGVTFLDGIISRVLNQQLSMVRASQEARRRRESR